MTLRAEIEKLVEELRTRNAAVVANGGVSHLDWAANKISALLAAHETEPVDGCRACEYGVCRHLTEDPEQAARERLGRWLAAEPRKWWRFQGKPQFGDRGPFGITLEGPRQWSGTGKTEEEAINDALDRAEGKAPT